VAIVSHTYLSAKFSIADEYIMKVLIPLDILDQLAWKNSIDGIMTANQAYLNIN